MWGENILPYSETLGSPDADMNLVVDTMGQVGDRLATARDEVAETTFYEPGSPVK